MALTTIWSAAEEAVPAGGDLRSLGDNNIRDLKLNLRERLIQDHEFGKDGLTIQTPDATNISDKDTGMHKQVTLKKLTGAPSAFSTTYSRVYSLAADRLIRVVDSAGTKILVDTDTAQTLSNKTAAAFPVAVGVVASGGGSLTGFGVSSVSQTDTGKYKVVLSNAVSAIATAVILAVVNGVVFQYNIVVIWNSTTEFTVAIGEADGTRRDAAVFFTVYDI